MAKLKKVNFMSESKFDSVVPSDDELYFVDLGDIDFVVESYSNGTEWYRIYKSGWIEQGGYIGQTTSTSQVNKFHKEMKDTNYHINITAVVNGWSGGLNSVFDLTTTSFKIWTSDDSTFNSCPIKWEVKGFKA